eukprot:SAG31_NODE_35788_length_319_cov_16.213636_1_plen_43_part_00
MCEYTELVKPDTELVKPSAVGSRAGWKSEKEAAAQSRERGRD